MEMKQCSVLFINPGGNNLAHAEALARAGFSVHETSEWPEDHTIRDHECVLLWVPQIVTASMQAARLRAKPHFGRRVLIAIVPEASDRRPLTAAGFDDIVTDTTEARLVVARVFRRLRERPEYRCLLPPRGHAA
jgi:hypothetical protein